MGIVLHGGIFNCSIAHNHSHFGLSHGHSHGDDNGPHDNNYPHSNRDNEQYSGTISANGVQSSHNVPGVKVKSKENRNINVRAALIHVLGDLIQSVGVLIAAYIIKYKVRMFTLLSVQNCFSLYELQLLLENV